MIAKAPKLKLESYILSISKYKDIKAIFEDGNQTKQEFENNHVLFMEDNDWVNKMFSKLLSTAEC